MRNVSICMSALVACVAFQNGANAQGIPVSSGPVDFAQEVTQVKALQAQMAELAAHPQGNTTPSQDGATNALLAQMLTVQRQTLSELASINQHLSVSEVTQRAAADTAREQMNMQVSNQPRERVTP